MKRADSAAELMAAGRGNCAQAVLTAFCEELGLEYSQALKVARAFGGGMGIGQTCGAVTGAYMMLGLKHNPDTSPSGREKMDKLIKDFNRKFVEKNGSLLCKELLGHDISKPEERAFVKESGLSARLCPNFVRSSIEILEKEG